MRTKTYVNDVERDIYDVKDQDRARYKTDKGISEDIVIAISKQKDEPKWMLDFRLKALKIYNKKHFPKWGPRLDELDIDKIVTYVKSNLKAENSWDKVPQDIKNTFVRLGIPEAERKFLAGVSAQYDSETVYRNVRKDLLEQGVIYTDMETAVKEHGDIVKEYFMKLVPVPDNKFTALHGAFWSGGSFIYVPPGVKLNRPLQAYFRVNAKGSGQFEHTIIIVDEGAELHYIEGCSAPRYNINNLHAGCVEVHVKDSARLRYSIIENWSKNMYNLNTKRAIIGKDGILEWVAGAFGSKIAMTYPMSILKGERAKIEYTGITFASNGQHLDTGAKVIHAAPYTTSSVNSKSISKNGGYAYYRSLLRVNKSAHHCKAVANCESLMLDNESKSDTLPIIEIKNDNVDIGHEAKIGRISDETIFYLMSRGIGESEAKAMIVRGFIEPITKELPLGYANKLNELVNLELEGTIG
ncbi:Fe-S cluster assembly protein SufB [Clostridiaceae bacterium M8S5]|nr:Fe-S cluster assembly protein SufB [Clostridiaceae bacterium M8S5]